VSSFEDTGVLTEDSIAFHVSLPFTHSPLPLAELERGAAYKIRPTIQKVFSLTFHLTAQHYRVCSQCRIYIITQSITLTPHSRRDMPPTTRSEIAPHASTTAMPSMLSDPLHEQVDKAATRLSGKSHHLAPELTDKICKLFLSSHPGSNRSWNPRTQHNYQANMTFDDRKGEVKRCVFQDVAWKPEPRHDGDEVGLCDVNLR
jgi:hypothetical protein